MLYLGILIAIGAAVTFILLGALTLFGGVDTTHHQIMPGFIPDQLSLVRRVMIFIGIWTPIVIVTLFCLLTGIQIVRIILLALI